MSDKQRIDDAALIKMLDFLTSEVGAHVRGKDHDWWVKLAAQRLRELTAKHHRPAPKAEGMDLIYGTPDGEDT